MKEPLKEKPKGIALSCWCAPPPGFKMPPLPEELQTFEGRQKFFMKKKQQEEEERRLKKQ